MENGKTKFEILEFITMLGWVPLWMKQVSGVIISFPLSPHNVLFPISSIIIMITVLATVYKGKLKKPAKMLLVIFRIVVTLLWIPVAILSLIFPSEYATTDKIKYYSPEKFDIVIRDATPEKIPPNATNVGFYYNVINFLSFGEEAFLQYDLPKEEYLKEKERIIQLAEKAPYVSEFYDGYMDVDFYKGERDYKAREFVSLCDKTGTIRFISIYDDKGIEASHFKNLDKEGQEK